MPQELLCSLLRITWDPEGASPVVLLDWDDDITGEPTLDGGQIVQTAEYLRAGGAVTMGRGNERHSLRVPMADEREGIAAAQDYLFSASIKVPRSSADVLIEVNGGGAYIMRNATIESWNGLSEGHITSRILQVTGGTIEQVVRTVDTTSITADTTLITADAA